MARGRPSAAAKAAFSGPSECETNFSSVRWLTHKQPTNTRQGRKSIGTIFNDTDRNNPDDDSTHCLSQVLKKVVIPASRSSLGSSLSSVRDQSSEVDTPATSAIMTPAEPPPKKRRRSVVASAPVGQTSASMGKRRRTTKDDLLVADGLLAETLQNGEWAEEMSHHSTSRQERIVPISDEPNVSMDVNVFEGEGLSENDVPSRRRRRTSYPSLSCSSRASSRTRKSFKFRTTRPVLDSEDDDLSESSDISAFTVGKDDPATFEDSEDAQDYLGTVSDTTSESVVATDIGTSAGQNVSVTVAQRRPGRGRRSQPGNRPARRRWHGMEDRAIRERKKLEKTHPEMKTMWDELKAVSIITPSQVDQPNTITRKLKSFQLEGLDWMIKQEKSQWKGGLLGDEMGMGKTIQAVSLIMSDYPAQIPTLVIVPPVALIQWQNEIAQYTDGKLRVLVYHNTNPKVKNLKVTDLRSFDVIMISYSGLESIYRKESKGWKRDDGLVKENSKIHAIHYHRLILDEAHNIKTRTTSVARSCFALKARFKWCLSGTPVQNRIGEFFSLLRFLQIQPFASYFCKKCPCAELHWNQGTDKKCTICHHTGFEHVSIFNQELLNPITQQGDPELRREALQKLRLITDRIMLRRMKRDYTASMELPPKEVIIHNEFFGEIERDFSSSIMSNTSRQFDTYVSRGVMLNNYANIFGLIMQMRQVANHPDLILRKHAEGGQNILVCSICDETAEEPIRSRCHHEFCRKCAKDYVKSFDDEMPDCPRCHIPLTIDFEQPDIEQDEANVKRNSIINRIKMEDWTSSTKIEMLVYDLYKLRSQKQTHKSIVFSQFTSMLQLVEWRLRRAGFNTVMLDGSMSPAQRQKSIEYFMNNTDVEVFLVSLKAGGVALNLTEASRVFIIDPWWNPAAEWQSADRCHRIGQKRPCVITRLCIEDSVESRMVMLQEKKANMINGTINNDQVAMEKLTPEDMQFLFRGN
ncbi:MAG: hypothetical protein Q9164_001315 [Protoblastenia rupestris]